MMRVRGLNLAKELRANIACYCIDIKHHAYLSAFKNQNQNQFFQN